MSDKNIAIVGVACRFPGANSSNEFWINLQNGSNFIKEIPKQRWDISKYYSERVEDLNKSVSKWCGILENVDKFDNQFFSISPREANEMDPQQRILLEEAWHCIEDSGIPLQQLQKKITSVYIGVMSQEYIQKFQNASIDSYACLGNYESILTNRISYIFDFKGESLPINAACASSLISIHEAKKSLLSKESDYSLVGGVNLNLEPLKYVSFSKSRMLSPDGQCKTFDKDANGYVPGDGVGVLLLQRLEDAVHEGNHIYGIIKGSAVSHTGKSQSITAPKVESQKELILKAYKDANISPETVTYVEVHGTGTSLGDPIEIEALSRAFREHTDKKQFCKVGSVKTNIGHLESAAGIAGVIKILEMFKHKKIPKTLNLNVVNPVIDFENSPFVVAKELSSWEVTEKRRASVSSFGFGGVNSHIILEEYNSEPISRKISNLGKTQSDPKNEHVFLLSAKNKESLKNLIEHWKEFINTPEYLSASIEDICMTLAIGRQSFNYRVGTIVKSKEDLEIFLQKQYDQNDIFVTKSDEKLLLCIDDIEINNIKKYHSLLMELENLGLRPDLVEGSDNGAILALMFCGIIKNKDNFNYLGRPRVPFYDAVNKEVITPYYFDKIYFEKLKCGTNDFLKNSPIIMEFIQKAKILNVNQFTFKRYLQEWNDVTRTFGIDIIELLDQEIDDRELGKWYLVLIIAIIASIKKLNQKWNLNGVEVFDKEEFRELLDLVTDEVLAKESIIKMLTSDNLEDIQNIIKLANKNQNNIDFQKPYSILKNSDMKLAQIPNTQKWVKSLIQADKFDLSNQDDIVKITVNDETFDNFNQLVLNLWLNGFCIDWSKWYTGNWNKISLPVYEYSRRSFWISNEQKNSNPVIKVNDKKDDLETFNGTEVELSIIDENIAMVIMQDKANRNMFTENIVSGLKSKFKEIQNNKNIKVIIITGYDNIFSMGGTYEQLTDMANKKIDFTNLEFMYKGLLNCPVPVISAIQGHALGGGMTFGLYGDIVIMAEDCAYSANYMKHGFTPGLGATFILPKKVGVNLANEMMFTGKLYMGEELRKKGAPLIFKKREEVLKEALDVARVLAERPTDSLRVLKQDFTDRITDDLDKAIKRELIMHDKTFHNFIEKDKLPEAK